MHSMFAWEMARQRRQQVLAEAAQNRRFVQVGYARRWTAPGRSVTAAVIQRLAH